MGVEWLKGTTCTRVSEMYPQNSMRIGSAIISQLAASGGVRRAFSNGWSGTSFSFVES